jgi:hypothetical protein
MADRDEMSARDQARDANLHGGAHSIGQGLSAAADRNNAALSAGFAHMKLASYAAELGNALDAHATEQGERFRPA